MNPVIALTHIQAIAEQIAPHCDGDEQLLQDMLEGETRLIDVAEWLHRQRMEAVETLDGIAKRKAALAEREGRYKAKEVTLKAQIGQLLRAAKLPNIVLPEATYSVRDGSTKLSVIDSAAVPEGYQRTTTSAAPDMAAIKDAFKDSDELPNWLSREPATDIVTARVK